MYCVIHVNYFTMDRGDTFELPLVINEGNQMCFKQYQLKANDKIYIAILQPNQSFEKALVRKVLTKDSKVDKKGNPIFRLNPMDTENLLTGKYFITAKLQQFIDDEEYVTTILPLKEFFINGTNKQCVTDDTFEVYNSINNSEEVSWLPI